MDVKKNPQSLQLISQIKEVANASPFWIRIANELKKPSRRERSVNVYQIEKYAKDGLTVVVPGKVLGIGSLSKKVDIVASKFSDSAIAKIKKAGGKATLLDISFVKKNADGKKMQILG